MLLLFCMVPVMAENPYEYLNEGPYPYPCRSGQDVINPPLLSIYNASDKDIVLILRIAKNPEKYVTLNSGQTYYYHSSSSRYYLYCSPCDPVDILFYHPITGEKVGFRPKYKGFLKQLVWGTFDHATRKIVIKTPQEKVFSKVQVAISGNDFSTNQDQYPSNFFLCVKNDMHFVIDADYNIARIENDVTMSSTQKAIVP